MIVFDSSTIILLAKLEMLDLLLNASNQELVITEVVKSEVGAKNTFDALLIQKRIGEGNIKVRKVNGNNIEKIMKDFSINIGEAETIALAITDKESLLATDDKNVINACKLLNIPFTTSIGLLLRAKEKNLLTGKEAEIKLDLLARYGRYKTSIINDAKRKLKGG